jgi:predicted  nucleic acid-binding Zn-ribbon protein
MKERLLKLYELHKIDKELQELDSLKGDIPLLIAELTDKKSGFEKQLEDIKNELSGIIENENALINENSTLIKKIEKNDEVLRSGAVKSNEEYNALAKEIELAYEHIDKNENILEKEIKGNKEQLQEKVNTLQNELEGMIAELTQNQETLNTLNEQTEEEEKELKQQREGLKPKVNPEDMEFYERINHAKFGDAMAIVRKGSCLGCFNSIPPQRAIEIRMADRFFTCESCGRILISEENIEQS